MNPALELLKASAAGPQGLDSYLQTHELTRQLAVEVRALYNAFFSKGQLEDAELAASVLAMLWLRLGDFQESLRNHIDHLQIRFVRAESPGEYAEIRVHALSAFRKALDCHDDEFTFRAAVLAADASYFAHEAGGQGLGFDVPRLLADLVAAAHRVRRATESPWVPRFLSLCAGILQIATSSARSRDEREGTDRSLRQLSTSLGPFRPSARYFPDDAATADQIDAALTALIDTYGE